MTIISFLKKFQWVLLSATTGMLLIAIIVTILQFEATLEPPRPKIGFIILGDITQPGWNASQYQGISEACRDVGIELLVRDKVQENSGQCPAAIQELVAQGCGMIFLCSYAYSAEARGIVEKMPHIAFATNSAEVHTRNMTAYFVRMYQGRYLAGALAGMRTKSNVIGYVAAIPNTEVNRGINAFTLGVQATNPAAKVVVAWTGAWEAPEKETANAKRLINEAGADVLTYHQDDQAVPDTAEAAGVYFIGYNTTLRGYSERNLASVLCRWDVYYRDILQRFLKGELNSVKNHWLGIDRGVVFLTDFSPAVTPHMRSRIAELREQLVHNKLIFSGQIHDNKGTLRCAAGEAISDDTLLEKIDWQVEGVKILE